jgi:hypothetical protein
VVRRSCIPPSGGYETKAELLCCVHAPDWGLWKTAMFGLGSHYRRPMRWDNLFDDLESQLEHELSAEDVDVRAEEERLRLGRLSLRDRVIATHDNDPEQSIHFVLVDGQSILGRPMSHGRDWFLIEHVTESNKRRHSIVPLAAVSSLVLSAEQVGASIHGSAPGREIGAAQLSDRLGLTFVLRDVCRRRSAVEIHTTSGVHRGTIDRVGKDHVDLAEHERGEPRRANSVTRFRVIPLGHVSLIGL